jgi:hypothetical protein
MRLPALAIAISILCVCTTAAPHPSVSERYDIADAYTIYSLLLPLEESYGFATDTLMIAEETMTYQGISRACLTSDAANKFRDAIIAFNRDQRKKWRLQSRFQINKEYKLVGSGVISTLPDYPQSSATLVSMSAVGFNPQKSRAIVYMESSCGGLCGSGRHHLLEKVHGKWKEVPGVTCTMAS